jgi:glycine/D-amino acid oxidase-like deaminating enzyme
MGNVVQKVGIGIIGCGNISSAYLAAARGFPVLDIRAVADLDLAAARRRGGGGRSSACRRSGWPSSWPIPRSRSC